MIKLVMTVALSKEVEQGLDEISRDAWSGEKVRMNQIGRTADRLLKLLKIEPRQNPHPSSPAGQQ